jgi:hypothetical protein
MSLSDANSVEVKGVLALDSMGTGRPITAEEEIFVQRAAAAAAVSTLLERMEKHQHQAEVVLQRARIASNSLIAKGAEARSEENATTVESEMAALHSGNDSAPAEGEAPAEEEAAIDMSDEEKAKHSTNKN